MMNSLSRFLLQGILHIMLQISIYVNKRLMKTVTIQHLMRIMGFGCAHTADVLMAIKRNTDLI